MTLGHPFVGRLPRYRARECRAGFSSSRRLCDRNSRMRGGCATVAFRLCPLSRALRSFTAPTLKVGRESTSPVRQAVRERPELRTAAVHHVAFASFYIATPQPSNARGRPIRWEAPSVGPDETPAHSQSESQGVIKTLWRRNERPIAVTKHLIASFAQSGVARSGRQDPGLRRGAALRLDPVGSGPASSNVRLKGGLETV